MAHKFKTRNEFLRFLHNHKAHRHYHHKHKGAPITWFLVVFLVITYVFQIFVINAQQELLQSLMTHPLHFLQGNFWSVLTSVFLHGSPVHLISNLIALLIFGYIVERHFGFMTLFLFIASGIIANIIANAIALMFGDMFFSLGASGAIAGLIIFAILLEPFALAAPFLPIPIFVLGWALITFDIVGLTNPSQINHLAHLGGYLALLVLYFFIEAHHKNKIVVGFFINIVMLIVLFLLSRIVDLNVLKEVVL